MCARLQLGLARPAPPARGCAVSVAPPSATTTQQAEHVLVRASAGITLRSLLSLPPPAPCYTCATTAPRLIFLWRSTTLICYVAPPKPPSPPPYQRKHDLPPNLHFWSFLDRSWSQEHQQYASAFRCCPPPPSSTQTLPRLSLCRPACAKTVCELRALPSLPLLFRYEYEERGVWHRLRRRRRRRWRRRRQRRQLRSERVCVGGGVAYARARMTAAATGGGGVRRDVATARRRHNCPSTRSPVGACWRRAP